MTRRILGIILGTLLGSLTAFAQTVALNPHHPDRYVVVKGDTLWDIAARFLKDPWLWPEIWYQNPDIHNPHLIYPGDVISLVYVNGKPRLKVQRGPAVARLSPKARSQSLAQAIPTIPLDAIRPFLTRPLVVGEHDLERAPYVLASADEHLIAGAGDRIYARGIQDKAHARYNLFRAGDAYVDPDTGEVLGYAALYLGEAQVQRFGDPATLAVNASTREIASGDRLLPVTDENTRAHFLPHAPAKDVGGRIIAVMDGVREIGQYQVVVLNRGTREGIEVGHVLRVRQAGETLRDPVDPKHRQVRLPDEDAGLVMVFRTFEKVSFGLVMDARRPIHVLDRLARP